jgi:hypothetical protein
VAAGAQAESSDTIVTIVNIRYNNLVFIYFLLTDLANGKTIQLGGLVFYSWIDCLLGEKSGHGFVQGFDRTQALFQRRKLDWERRFEELELPGRAAE